jgi:hypothetical protein
MSKLKTVKVQSNLSNKSGKIDFNSRRRNRIENLKTMINNEDYVKEAIKKLANSLTSGLMK